MRIQSKNNFAEAFKVIKFCLNENSLHAYRDWAKKIYSNIQKNPKNHSFLNLDHKISNLEKKIKNFNPDLILWYGWSEKINEEFVNKYFSVMLHPSPLPKYRGGSPIQNQIINGESKSAVTLFKINNKIDQGDIIYQKEFLLDNPGQY